MDEVDRPAGNPDPPAPPGKPEVDVDVPVPEGGSEVPEHEDVSGDDDAAIEPPD